MELRVNLRRREVIESCVGNERFVTTGKETKELERAAFEEYTGLCKRRRHSTLKDISPDFIPDGRSNDLFTQLNSHPRSPQETFLLGMKASTYTNKSTGNNKYQKRNRKKQPFTIAFNKQTARKQMNSGPIATVNHGVVGTNYKRTGLSKRVIREQLNDFAKCCDIELPNDCEDPSAERCAWTYKQSDCSTPMFLNGKIFAYPTKLNGMINHAHIRGKADDEFSRPSTSFQKNTSSHESPIPLMPIESLRVTENCLSPKTTVVVPDLQEIQRLTKVVESLRTKYREKQILLKNGPDDRRHLESPAEIEEKKTDFVEDKLNNTVNINQVVFTTANGWVENIDSENRTLLRHQTIEGCAGAIPFTLQLLIQEDGDMEGPLENTFVVDLDLIVHKSAQEELESFIDKMRNVRDVMLCMKGLKDYASWQSMRQRTFEYFRDLYPGKVSIVPDKQGRELLIQSQPSPNIRATVTWTVTTEETGHLTPSISLKVQKTRQAGLADKDYQISKLSHMFQMMLQVLGIERTISTMIDMIRM